MEIPTGNSAETVSSGTENYPVSNFKLFKDCFITVKNETDLNMQVKKYNNGEYLIKAGNPGESVFCIQKGFVKLSRNNNRKKEFIFSIAGKGDLIGLNTFIDNESFYFSAVAIDQVVACSILTAGLKNMLQKEPDVSLQLMKNLCKELDVIEQRITSISGKNLREHCAEVIHSLAVKCEPENGKHYSVSCSIHDLASLTGTTRSYLYKILLDFAGENILSFQSSKIIIHNMTSLSAIAKETGNRI